MALAVLLVLGLGAVSIDDASRDDACAALVQACRSEGRRCVLSLAGFTRRRWHLGPGAPRS